MVGGGLERPLELNIDLPHDPDSTPKHIPHRPERTSTAAPATQIKVETTLMSVTDPQNVGSPHNTVLSGMKQSKAPIHATTRMNPKHTMPRGEEARPGGQAADRRRKQTVAAREGGKGRDSAC